MFGKYKLKFKCENCGKKFFKKIPIGIDVHFGTSGTCYLYKDGYRDLKGNYYDNCLKSYIKCIKCDSDDVIKDIGLGI